MNARGKTMHLLGLVNSMLLCVFGTTALVMCDSPAKAVFLIPSVIGLASTIVNVVVLIDEYIDP